MSQQVCIKCICYFVGFFANVYYSNKKCFFKNKKYILEFMVFLRYSYRGRYGVLVKCIVEKKRVFFWLIWNLILNLMFWLIQAILSFDFFFSNNYIKLVPGVLLYMVYFARSFQYRKRGRIFIKNTRFWKGGMLLSLPVFTLQLFWN